MADGELPGRRGALTGSLWYAASSFVPVLATTLLSVVMGRVLGPEELGEQTLISYVEALLFALLVTTVTQATIQSIAMSVGAADKDLRLRVERVAMLAHTVAAALVAATLVAIGVARGGLVDWALVAAVAVTDGRGWAYGARRVGALGWRSVSARRLVSQTSAQLLAVVLVLAGGGITAVFAAHLVTSTALLISLWRLVGRAPSAPLTPLPPGIVSLWLRFAALESVNQVVSRRIEFLFLGALSSPDQVAMYSIPFQVVTVAAMIPTSILGSAMPAVAAHIGARGVAEVARQLGPALRTVSLMSAPLAAGVAVLGGPVVALFYGDEFVEAARLVPLLALTVLATPVAALCFAFWSGAGRLGPPLGAGIVAGLLDATLAWILVPAHGAWGAATANVAAQLTFAVALVTTTWFAGMRFVLPTGRYVAQLALCGMAATLAGVLVAGRSPVAALLLGLVVCGGILATYGFLVGFLPRIDRAWFDSSLPERLRPIGRLMAGPSAPPQARSSE